MRVVRPFSTVQHPCVDSFLKNTVWSLDTWWEAIVVLPLNSLSPGLRLAVVQLAIFFVLLLSSLSSDYFPYPQSPIPYLFLSCSPIVSRSFQAFRIAISVFVASIFPRPSRHILSSPALHLPFSQRYPVQWISHQPVCSQTFPSLQHPP